MKSAIISECGLYRYQLERKFNEYANNPAIFCMLNPSTADANIDDPTIRKCMAFAKLWNYDSIKVVNLYAFRATNPKELLKCIDPIGKQNDDFLIDVARKHKKIICAWGNNAKIERVKTIVGMMEKEADLYCLGVTKSGMPKHPLYIKYTQELLKFSF